MGFLFIYVCSFISIFFQARKKKKFMNFSNFFNFIVKVENFFSHSAAFYLSFLFLSIVVIIALISILFRSCSGLRAYFIRDWIFQVHFNWENTYLITDWLDYFWSSSRIESINLNTRLLFIPVIYKYTNFHETQTMMRNKSETEYYTSYWLHISLANLTVLRTKYGPLSWSRMVVCWWTV